MSKLMGYILKRCGVHCLCRTHTVRVPCSERRFLKKLSTANTLAFDATAFIYPHVSKIEKGGEDAVFCHERYLGVADGVGSWASLGLYSRELLYHVQKELGLPVKPGDMGEYYTLSLERLLERYEMQCQPTSNRLKNQTHPLEVLQVAHSKTMSQGSSTCALVFLNPLAHTAMGLNLGDSGYVVFSGDTLETICESKAQHHDHNIPRQLGPTSLDRPNHATTDLIPVKRGDWIVVATDGLWDNLYLDQIRKIIKCSSSPAEAAKELADEAFERCMDLGWKSPFSMKEKRYRLVQFLKQVYGQDVALDSNHTIQEILDYFKDHMLYQHIKREIQSIRGGKPDDISGAVARVV